MSSAFALAEAQSYLRDQKLDGWLLEDFQYNNPILWQVVGGRRHSTRRVFLLIPPTGSPRFLVHQTDAARFGDLGWPTDVYLSRRDQDAGLQSLLAQRRIVAMEYSPECALPVVSRVDAGTLEQVRSLGITVVSSGDVLQFAVARWSPGQVSSHRRAAEAVVKVASDTFEYIGDNLRRGVDEVGAADFVRRSFAALNLVTESGPDVAVNEHSGDPHYEASAATSLAIQSGDWILIDLWAKDPTVGAVYGDSTWVGYAGAAVPAIHRQVFDSVRRARDLALDLLSTAWHEGRVLEGWEVDAVARASIESDGFGRYFTHRLGHSLGESIHSNGVNLDGFETRDTRTIISGVGFSVEPGIYLPDFGIRLEVNVYVDPNGGPQVTTPIQSEVVLIG
ncbi:MAG TPA: M24 family metallopeptidase [Chloroflexota bacterium]|nr:M24 family metallopeptidase [Chloroflexota bacterium]